MKPRHILISGAGGFIGRHLVEKLLAKGHRVTGFYRSNHDGLNHDANWIKTGDLGQKFIDPEYGKDVDVFIHLAAAKHITSDGAEGFGLQTYGIAENIANFINKTKIRNVICLSSIAASIAEESPDKARRYGIEKLAADKILMSKLDTVHRLVILRPPAVYGHGMKGSLAQLASLVRRGVPLPLGSAREPRHYISLENITALMVAMAEADDDSWELAANKIFEVSDGQAVSTRNLIKMIGENVGRKPRLFPFPLPFLRLIGKITGKNELISGAIDRLDISSSAPLEEIFRWRPQEKMPQSLGFLAKRQ